jgi:hypothetical protein
MRSPIHQTPPAVQRWISHARALRWADGLVAWLVVMAVFFLETGSVAAPAAAISAAAVVVVCALMRPLRLRWRPVSALVGLRVSRTLRPGDRAWYVRGERADLVIVTARRGLRLSIAAPELGAAESLNVRRTRVLVVPAALAV